MAATEDYAPLKDRLERVFRAHVEKDNGLIAGPDRLIENCLNAVSSWLAHDEENWGDTEAVVSEALRDLRTNQLR